MKKSIKISIYTCVSLILLALFQIIYTYSKIDNALIDYRIFSQSEKIQKIIKDYEVVECKFSLFKPQYSIVAFKHYPENDRKTYDIALYEPFRPHIFSANWQIEYVGGTDIRNTTFPELVDMAKENCEQFQDDYYNDNENGINWGYREAEPSKSQEIIDWKKKGEILSIKKSLKTFDKSTQDLIRKKHGDWEDLNDDELLEFAKGVGNDEEIQRIINPYAFDDSPDKF